MLDYKWLLLLLFFSFCVNSQAQTKTDDAKAVLFFPDNSSVGGKDSVVVAPLQQLAVTGAKGTMIVVKDGSGAVYATLPVKPVSFFTVGGALGNHTVIIYGAGGKVVQQLRFFVDAKTDINDGGVYKDMFNMFYEGMWPAPNHQIGSVTWNGKLYHYFIPWGLDHNHTMMGLKYFDGRGSEFIDLCREAQRSDGMIWSFVQYMSNPDYWLTRDKYTGYSRRIGDKVFVRQPTENHPEYIFVNSVYQVWKSTGDEAWMKKSLAAAAKALDYSVTDPARYSKRFGLLKRVHTIDSWDFAVEDEYLPDLGITNSMIIDPVKSKFGIFFGDNTGYITACRQLAEMYQRAGMNADASRYKQRADEMKKRLDSIAWNGRFYMHFIEEDSTIIRHLGVDEKKQLAQSNAYSLNRDIDPSQKKAIIETYLHLKDSLPVGSPGEWYAIYPPYQRGFGQHDEIWQYMNGGVGGHVAGELARGALANGYEAYGVDVLNRLYRLGKAHGNKVYFAYTGATLPPPPAPVYKPLNLAHYANMDVESKGSSDANPWMLVKRGDDFAALPLGEQTFSNIRFRITDPATNNRKSVVAVSHRLGFPASVEIPVNDSAKCIYLLHTSSKPTSENVSGIVTFVYADGSQKAQYIINGKHLTYWWFSELKNDYAGIAWYGKNSVSEGIGLSWCAINNPEPQKLLSKILLSAPADSTIYTVFGISLSNQPHYVPVNPVSFGGPDEWASALAMAALVEGVAGVSDKDVAYKQPVVASRWTAASVDSVNVTVRYPASGGYVSYRFQHNRQRRQITLAATGNGETLSFHVLLPEHSSFAKVTVNNKAIAFKEARIEASTYANFSTSNTAASNIVVEYSDAKK